MTISSLRLTPARFVIEAVSPEPQQPESENYEIRTQLNDASWTAARGEVGIGAIEAFLFGWVDENTMSVAIEELSYQGRTDILL